MAQQPHPTRPLSQPIHSFDGIAGSYPAPGSGRSSATFQYIATHNQPDHRSETLFEVASTDGGEQGLPYQAVSERKPIKQDKRGLPFFDEKTKLRRINKSFWRYILPEIPYPSGPEYRHRDPMGRVTYHNQSDRYTRSWDCRLRNLYVQSTDQVRLNAPPNSSTWRRTHIRSSRPLCLIITAWIMDNVSPDPRERSILDWAKVIRRSIVASVPLIVVILLGSGRGEIQNNGYYEGLPYYYWHYMRTYRNMEENRKAVAKKHWSAGESRRALRSKKLCYLTECGILGTAYIVQDTEGLEPIDYLFIAYTTYHFPGPEGKRRLLEIAEAATRSAGLDAFWIGVECLPELAEQGSSFNPEIHLISDIIRGCTKLVIALPEPNLAINEAKTWRELLTQWGMRMWTFPEALLSPGNEIPVYVYGDLDSLSKPVHLIPKAQFAEFAWGDAYEARQLMDHFLGNLILTRLEFTKVAVQCLLKRARMDEAKDGKDSKLLLGDMVYCYSGLVRKRPIVDGQDTEFEVFAKSSFANDSDQLLERLVCLLPKNNNHWFTTDDAWGAELYDIYPTCQIAAVDKNSVLLDGCRGAAIRWKRFTRVAYIDNFAWGRNFADIMLQLNTITYSLLLILGNVSSINYVMLSLSILSLIIMVGYPWLIQKFYGGKLWNTQACFFGFEGYIDIETIERMIFGNYKNRFMWSIASSTLSTHKEDEYGECIGLDPTGDPEVWVRVQKAARSSMGEEKIFTFVDTYTMTVTLFSAVRPPTAVLICGVEGGSQRAVLCSYDWQSGTLCRETILRMDSTALNRLDRLPRVRFGFHYPDVSDVNTDTDNPSHHQNI